jgi:hypothetical protein
MKKLIALLVICAMGTSLFADFSEANWIHGGFTLPVAYTGTLKAAAWADDGLCYNWEKGKDTIPLFLGLCQPCLECVPCDIDMLHAAPTIQKNAAPAVDDALAANAGIVDPTEAFFNRARLYIVTDVQKAADGKKPVTIQVVDLIDAYGTAKPYSTFQFYNTVDKIDNELKPEKGRIAAFFSFPIIERTSAYDYPFALNQYAVAPVLGSTDDGIGMAALIGTKDSKNWFKYDNAKYKIVAIKKMDGDLMIAQDSYTDTPCRAGADYIYGSALDAENPKYDGAGAWWATASISLRRNDSVTKKMMAAVVAEAGSVNCIPCNTGAVVCREYLDQGIVDLMIEKKYKAASHAVTYLVDTDLDYVYGDPATVAPATRNQALVGRDAYLNDVKTELPLQLFDVP